MATQTCQENENRNRAEDFPTAFAEAQQALAPYIKTRQEVAHIRRVLAAHLDAQLSFKNAQLKISLLSLVDSSATVKISSGHLGGLRKEYLRSLRSNIRARKEYDNVGNSISLHKCDSVPHRPDMAPASKNASGSQDTGDYLDGYLALVKQKQRVERVRIMQECLDNLEQHSASATTFLDSGELGVVPKFRAPPDVVTGSGGVGFDEAAQKELRGLVRDLEIAVLRAKVQLRNERRLLGQAKATQSKRAQDNLVSMANDAQVLQALGRTRDELIAWVEEELGKAGDSAPQDENGGQVLTTLEDGGSVEEQLLLIRDQYDLYVKARKALLETLADLAEPDLPVEASQKTDSELNMPEKEVSSSATWITASYLRKLHSISDEQKSLIQQKSHLTVCLAKQYKETVQAFDRLADESHLLPLFPSSAIKESSRGLGQPKMAESPDMEVPNASHRVRTWTLAAESARSATQDAIFLNTEEGDASLQAARDVLSTLDELLGCPTTQTVSENLGRKAIRTEEDIWISGPSSREAGSNRVGQRTVSPSKVGDMWASIDGQLGVLNKDDE